MLTPIFQNKHQAPHADEDYLDEVYGAHSNTYDPNMSNSNLFELPTSAISTSWSPHFLVALVAGRFSGKRRKPTLTEFHQRQRFAMLASGF